MYNAIYSDRLRPFVYGTIRVLSFFSVYRSQCVFTCREMPCAIENENHWRAYDILYRLTKKTGCGIKTMHERNEIKHHIWKVATTITTEKQKLFVLLIRLGCVYLSLLRCTVYGALFFRGLTQRCLDLFLLFFLKFCRFFPYSEKF